MKLSWDEVDHVVDELIPNLPDVTGIVCVSRGGLVPGALIAGKLNVKLVRCVAVSSYDGKSQRPIELLTDLHQANSSTIVVDDLVDTGSTFKFLRSHDELSDATFVSLYAKPKGRPLTDIFARKADQDTWIYFPWECYD